MTQPRTIAIDFDGVLHAYDGDHKAPLGRPLDGAKRAVDTFLAAGCQVVVFSTRNALQVSHWLGHHGFPQLPVTATKGPFWAMIDDRAHRFNGAWTAQMVHGVLKSRAHWEA